MDGRDKRSGSLPMSDRLILALIAVIGLIYLVTLRAGHVWGDDFSQYLWHARNLVHGAPYGQTRFVPNPHVIVGPRAYPPVFPLLLAPVYAVFGPNLEIMKVEMVLCLVLFLVAYARLMRGELPPLGVALAVCVVGLNPRFWDFKDHVGSDFPFLLVVYGALVCVSRWQRRSGVTDPGPGRGLLAGLMIYVACGTRALGVALIPALALSELLRARRWTRFATAGVVVAAGIWTVEQALIPSGYGHELATLFSRRTVLVNAIGYLEDFSNVWSTGTWTRFFEHTLAGVILGAAVLTALVRLRLRPTIAEAFLLFYMVGLLFWPSRQGVRFLLPMVPLCVFYASVGGLALARDLPARWAPLQAASLAGICLLLYGAYARHYAEVLPGQVAEGVGRPASRELFAWVRTHTAPDELLVFRKPRALYFFTDRPTTPYHRPADPEELWRHFREVGARVLIVQDHPEDAYLREIVRRHPERLRPVYTNAEFVVYRFAWVSSPEPDSG